MDSISKFADNETLQILNKFNQIFNAPNNIRSVKIHFHIDHKISSLGRKEKKYTGFHSKS